MATVRKIIANLLVTSFILWTNLDLSIGQDYDDDYSNFNNETGPMVNWDHESIVVVRWDIDYPPRIDYENLRFDIHFSVSDYIEAQKHVRYDIYQDAGCLDSNYIVKDSDGYMKTWVTEDDKPVGVGIYDKRTVTISNQLIAENIRQSRSYKEGEGLSGLGGDSLITYCVRFSLWNAYGPSDPAAYEVNHMTVAVALNLDMVDEDFSISGQEVMARKKNVETSDDQLFLEAFVCDEGGNRPSLAVPFNQGDAVRICIQPTKQAAEVGFRMKGIEKFYFIQGVISQSAVLNAEVSSNMLTVLECQPGAIQCWFETMLFSHFYQYSADGTVVGNGEATLQWGGEGVDRRLQFELVSELVRVEEIDANELVEIEEGERLLRERISKKSMQVPFFRVLADTGRERPRLVADVRAEAMAQLIVLVSLVMIFCVVLFLPLIYYYSQEPVVQPDDEIISVQRENDVLSVFDDIDRWVLSMVPDDRTVVSVKSFLSKGFYSGIDAGV